MDSQVDTQVGTQVDSQVDTEVDTQIDVVKRNFHKDVVHRAVFNTSAREPCACGCYEYYSQRCGCLYKSVYLKCGKTKSKKTGKAILCKAGYGRKVRVEDVVVPFRCPRHRQGYDPVNQQPVNHAETTAEEIEEAEEEEEEQ
ncbi:hypothetical protein GGS26DRAFT_600105 [Hypomontagnella submonticulosa]|nr:hypothetical protein GGS26DRAFT_600105 [Hypomontagnella submonticulosa]